MTKAPDPRPEAPGRLQAAYAVLYAVVLLGVNFGPNSGVETIATKASPLTTPIQAILLIVLAGLAARYRAALAGALPRLAPFLIFLGLAVGSALWSQAPEATLRRSLSLASLMAFGLYAHAVLGTAATCRMLVVATWLSAAASLAVLVIAPQSGLDVGGYAGAVRGVFTQKNSLGSAMVAGTMAVAFLVLNRRRVLWTDIATVVMAACMIRLAQSTTALLLLAVVLFATVGAMLWMRGTVWSLYGLMVMSAFVMIVAWIVIVEPASFYGLLGKNDTLTGRAQIWTAVLRATNGWPLLGYGYSAFWLPDSHAVGDIWYALGWETPSAHNGYLDTAIQIGVVGLAILAALAALTIAGAVWAIRHGREAAAFWALMQIMVIVVYNYDESSLSQPDIFLLQWILAFMACGYEFGISGSGKKSRMAWMG